MTEKVDGKPKTSTFKAKNADELKKKHPEAYKLYKEHAAGNQNAVIGNIQLRVVGGVGAAARRPALQQLERARQQLAETTRKLRKLTEDGAKPAQLAKLIDELEAAQRELTQAANKLRPGGIRLQAVPGRLQAGLEWVLPRCAV